MTDLIKSYGRGLTALFVGLTVVWLAILIVVPQGVMIEQSLWSKERGNEISLRIDRAYTELSTLEYDLEQTEDEALRLEKRARIAELQGEITTLEAQEQDPPKIYGLQNYTRMSGLHFEIFVKTIIYSIMVTVLALVVCYPIAYVIAHMSTPNKAAILLLGLTIPYAINELLRVYAWLMILDYQGVINSLLAALGFVDLEARTWIPFLEYSGSVFVALIYAYILFMVFPIYNTLETLDKNQIEAAEDLGASTWRTHWRVIIPHAKPGIAVGCIMTFMLSAGSYSVPQIMTRGTSGDWFSQLIYRQFFESFNWNQGSAYAFTLLVVCIVFIFAMMAMFRVGLRDIAK